MIARLMIAIGVLEIVFATLFLIMGLLVQPADIPVYGDFVNNTYCGDGEKVVRVAGPKNYDGSQSIYFYCQDSNGVQQESVTDGMTLMLVGSFLVPLLSGIFFVIIGSSIVAKQKANQWLNAFGTVNLTTDGGSGGGSVFNQSQQYDLTNPKSVMSYVQDVMQQARTQGFQSSNVVMGGDGDLATKLQQLQEARDKGLISPSEYEQMRQTLLNNFKQ